MNHQEREASADILKAMAHPVRLGVIELLAEGPKTVSELHEALECSQSVMSAQLRVLCSQRLINMDRDANRKICSLRNRDFLRLFECLHSHIQNVLKI